MLGGVAFLTYITGIRPLFLSVIIYLLIYPIMFLMYKADTEYEGRSDLIVVLLKKKKIKTALNGNKWPYCS